jgi:hypothetical protein
LIRHPPIIAPIGAQRQALLTERLHSIRLKHIFIDMTPAAQAISAQSNRR